MLCMSRYTEWIKEKVLCAVCNTIICRGHRNAHLQTKKHKLNILNNDIDDKQSNKTN